MGLQALAVIRVEPAVPTMASVPAIRATLHAETHTRGERVTVSNTSGPAMTIGTPSSVIIAGRHAGYVALVAPPLVKTLTPEVQTTVVSIIGLVPTPDTQNSATLVRELADSASSHQLEHGLHARAQIKW